MELKTKTKPSKEFIFKQSYKIFFGLLGVFFVLFDWINGLHNMKFEPHSDDYNYFFIDGNTYTLNYYSFFTVQSNIFCILFLLISAIFPHKEGNSKYLSAKVALATSIYISITMLIFNFLLLPQFLSTGEKLSTYDWISMEFLHGVLPISFLVYFFFFFKKWEVINIKRFLKLKVWYYMIYPIGYCILALIRGTLINYKNYIQHNLNDDNFYSYYNYFFLDVWNANHTFLEIPYWAWFIIAFSIVLLLMFGLSALFILLKNKIQENNNGKIAELEKN